MGVIFEGMCARACVCVCGGVHVLLCAVWGRYNSPVWSIRAICYQVQLGAGVPCGSGTLLL